MRPLIRKIGIIGAGTMGGGIAQAAAQSGFRVILKDLDETTVRSGIEKIRARLERRVAEGKLGPGERDAVLSHIEGTVRPEDLRDADLIIEAAVEKEEIKEQVFKELAAVCNERTVFATNTSSISITRLARTSGRPDRFIGMHFMNPAYVMKLVEVVKGERTSEETLESVTTLAERMGKIPVVVNDSPGFVSNRLLMPMINDAVFCLEEGVCTREGIDTIMRLGANHPMGPLELADFIGLDVCLSILDVLHAELGEKYRPCPLLRKVVAAGKLGRKSGEGFYEYR